MLLTRSRSARLVTLAVAAAGAIGLAFSGSALAAPVTAPTEVTFTLNAGTLALSAPATASASGTIGTNPTLTATIPANQVTDNTGSLLGWTVTATATDLALQGATDGTKIDRQQMAWTSSNL